MKLVFMGTPDFAAASLGALIDGGHTITGVFTQPDRAVGRGMKMGCSPVKELALQASLPIFQPVKMRDGTALGILRGLEPDLVVVVAYGRILPEDMLAVPRLGCINVHASLLPELRGAAPIQWAVARGYEKTGVTTMYMASELDAGDMIFRAETPILPGDTAGSLHDRLRDMGAALLLKTVEAIERGGAPRVPQEHSKATFAPIIKKEDGRLDFSRPARELDCLIRGMNPWPGAYCKDLKIHAAEPLDRHSNKPAGTILEDGCVVCGDGGLLRLTEVQGPGGRRMPVVDYLRGHDISFN